MKKFLTTLLCLAILTVPAVAKEKKQNDKSFIIQLLKKPKKHFLINIKYCLTLLRT